MNAEMHLHQSNRNIRLIELMFFAYRDFTHDADLLLDELGLGRAHHRILHFVWRNPGIHVAELLNLLKITKQSLAMPREILIKDGFLQQHQDQHDKRKRILQLTQKGEQLAKQLCDLQEARFERALKELGAGADKNAEAFLYALADEENRADITQWISNM